MGTNDDSIETTAERAAQLMRWILEDDGDRIKSTPWVRDLIEFRFDRGRTPLMEAAFLGKLAAMNSLLELDADLGAVDDRGRRGVDYVNNFGEGQHEERARQLFRMSAMRVAMREQIIKGRGQETPAPAKKGRSRRKGPI